MNLKHKEFIKKICISSFDDIINENKGYNHRVYLKNFFQIFEDEIGLTHQIKNDVLIEPYNFYRIILSLEADLYLYFHIADNITYKDIREKFRSLMNRIGNFRRDYQKENELKVFYLDSDRVALLFKEELIDCNNQQNLNLKKEDIEIISKIYSINKKLNIYPSLVSYTFIKIDVDRVISWIKRYNNTDKLITKLKKQFDRNNNGVQID